jgi:hypothetical protein
VIGAVGDRKWDDKSQKKVASDATDVSNDEQDQNCVEEAERKDLMGDYYGRSDR